MDDPSCPKALLEMQTWFANIIISAYQETDDANIPIYQSSLIEEICKQIAPSPQLKSEERMGIYHQQYWWRLLTIMQELFPSLVRLFDYEDFNRQIAGPYLVDFPPKDWFISNIGLGLPDWIEKNYKEKDYLLVLELARLDQVYERLVFTNFSPPIEPERLELCEKEILYLQPHVLLFETHVDFFTFRKQLLEHPPEHWKTNDLPSIKKSRDKTFFVLFRLNENSLYEEILEEHFQLLMRFKKGTNLLDIVPLLEKGGDVIEWFRSLVSRGWLSFS